MANDDSFRFALTGNRDIPFLGYNSVTDPTNLSSQYLVEGSKNVYLNNNGDVAVRPGLKLIGTPDTTEDGVVASYEFEASNGMTLPLRVLNSGKMQFEFNSIWYLLKTFDLTRFVFSLWWDDTNKLETLIMVNGDSNLYQWNAAITFYGSQTGPTSGGTTVVGGPGGIVTTARITGGSISGTYVVGDTFTLVGGNNDATFEVTAVSSGVPTEFKIVTPGSGYSTGNYSTTVASPSGASGVNVAVDRVDAVYTLTNNQGVTWASIGFNNAPVLSGQSSTLIGLGNAIVLNGIEYTYFGGTDTDTLTNVFATTATDVGPVGNPGDLITQQVFTTFDKPQANGHNDFIVTLNNQLIVGSYTSKVIHISFDEDYTRYTQGNDLVPGDPDFAIIDEFPTGAAVKGQSIYIFAGNSNTYVLTPNTPAPIEIPIGGGSFALVTTTVEKQVGSGKSAAIAQEFITTIGEDIIYLAQDHQLRQLGTLRNIVTQKTPSLSKAIKQELVGVDFTGGCIRAVDEFVYLVSPLTGRTYLYQIRDDVDQVGNLTAERLWHPYQEWGFSRIAIIDGVVAGYSSTYPQLYQIWDTDQWHDDSPQGVPSPYECIARFAYQNNGLKTGQISFSMAYYEGYIAPNSELTGRVRFDYLGGTKNSSQSGVQDVVISSIAEPGGNGSDGHQGMTLFIGESVAELGVSQVGAQEIGGTTNLLQGFPKFRVIQDIEPTDVFEYQMELYSYSADSRWELKCLGVNATQSVNNPVFLRKS